MDKQNPLKADSSAVMKHVSLYQDIIKRMAGSSTDCKKWAVALVSAILVLVAKDGKVEYAWLAWIPAVLFCFLDAYYLGLEKQFRNAYGKFVNKLHADKLTSSDLYKVETDGKLPKEFLEALLSHAVWPFYLGIILMVAGAKWVVILEIANASS